MSDEEYLDADDAARWLGISSGTLQNLRVAGIGPAYEKARHRVRYRVADLEEWSARRAARDAWRRIEPREGVGDE